MTPEATRANSMNGATPAHELFALTDEQILEIEPQAKVASTSSESETAKADSSLALGMTASSVADAQPPAWLERQMKGPWAGEEARELWDGVLRAQAEAAEYKQVFEKPEAARVAAERARALDEFDAAYFGAAGKSPEETSAARAALAQRLLREDPAAFQEMVAASVKVLDEAGSARNQKTVAQAFRPEGVSSAADSVASEQKGFTPKGVSYNPTSQTPEGLAAYGAFEKAANADLEKSVGGAIERALKQALPNLQTREEGPTAGARSIAPLQERLGGAVRQEIEKALQGDRQLGEQVAQVLSSRRFDDIARAQVVRLINERAQQLVPSATKRVLNDWTQTTLAAHRAKTAKQETAGQRADLAPAQQGRERASSGSEQRTAGRASPTQTPRGRIDYKKLSDEQILEL